VVWDELNAFFRKNSGMGAIPEKRDIQGLDLA